MKRWGVALGLATALAAATLVVLLRRPEAAELAGLVASGGERPLREPMRAPRPGPRVLVFALDGVGEGELLDAIASDRAPALASLLGRPSSEGRVFAHGYAVPGVLSILPSTTLAAWSTLFTGRPAAETGVPGNEWFAREEMRYYAPAPVSVSGTADALASYTEGLVGRVLRVPTVFERADVRAYVSLSHIHRGADLLVVPAADAVDDLMGAALEGTAESDESVSQEAYVELDLTAVDNLVESIHEHGVADLQVVYLPGIDLYTHVAESPLESQRGYVATVVDSAVAQVLGAYRAAGALDDTYVLFVADHGHTPVLSDDRHALGTGDDEPTGLLARTGFRVRPPELEIGNDERDYQATVAYQGAFAYVYLADRSTCAADGTPCDWARPPRLEEDVLQVVRAFDAANRTGAGVPALRGTLDLILARAPRPTTEPALPFRVWDGERLVDMGEWLAANPRPDLLDFERRMSALAAGPFGHRAGDVLLIARSGNARPLAERFYFSGEYRSWHGSASEQDSRIPLVVAHPALSGEALRARVRAAVGEAPMQEDITPLILALLRGRPLP